ncbi:hypothetical protein GW17_00050591, partial [Ensete ventricosum]
FGRDGRRGDDGGRAKKDAVVEDRPQFDLLFQKDAVADVELSSRELGPEATNLTNVPHDLQPGVVGQLTTRGRTARTSVLWQRRGKGARIWPMACKGLTMPPNTMRPVGEDAAGLALGGGGWFIGDYAIDVDEEAFDQGDESVEAAGDDAKLPQDLEAPTMLKMMSITESGSRPKWSIPSTSFAASIRHSGDPKPGTAAGGRHRIGTLSIETDRAIA